MNNNIYPWQSEVWQQLLTQKQRMHHALLLHGKQGIGKLDFALHLSQSLLCAEPQAGHACGQCAKCVWFKEGNHPDFKMLTPEETEQSEDAPKKKSSKKQQISVDQIRLLLQTLSLSNHGTLSLRIILIQPAETLNTASANALLKVLEEPPNNTIFILVCHQTQRLLPTILSRCHSILMPIPDKDTAVQWLAQQHIQEAEAQLAYYGGSPLSVMHANEHSLNRQQILTSLSKGARSDIFYCVPMLLEHGMELAITMLQKWVYDLLLSVHHIPLRYHAQHTKSLQALANGVNLSLLLVYQKQLLQAKQTANHPLSQELQLEQLLLQYTKIFKL